MIADFTISPMLPEDWPDVRRIYQDGMNTGIATFETRCPEYAEWDKKFHSFARLVVRQDGAVIAWAVLAPVSARPVYAGVAEVTIYVDLKYGGKGVGTALMNELVKVSEANGIWTLQSNVWPPNKSSIRIHEKAGFRIVGYRERIGQRNGVWSDTLLMERRSKVVGV